MTVAGNNSDMSEVAGSEKWGWKTDFACMPKWLGRWRGSDHTTIINIPFFCCLVLYLPPQTPKPKQGEMVTLGKFIHFLL